MTATVPNPEKRRLREQVLKRRSALAAGTREAASRRIMERLAELPEFREAAVVHCFASLPEEVETEPIFEACWAAGKKTFVPVQIRGQGVLGAVERRPGDKLAAGPFGVPEPPPESRRMADPAAIDLLIAPGVAFDREGNRLGYGKGYYDKFLAVLGEKNVERRGEGLLLEKPAVVALAFSIQVVDSVPSEGWDEPVGIILTERELIRTERQP